MIPRTLAAAIMGFTLLFSGTSHAARVWMFHNVFIEDVIYANAHGASAVRIILSSTSQPAVPYNCPPTSEVRAVSYWENGTNAYMTNLMSIALTAQAQQLPVDIMVETSECSSSGSSWDNGPGMPNGMGLQLRGIRVRGQ